MNIHPQLQGSWEEYERARRTVANAQALFTMVEPFPPCIVRAEGARIWDVDGNCYVDYAMAYGPLLLGHSPREVLDAVHKQLDAGIGYGRSHRLQTELAEAICRTVPSAEQCILSNTGSEAVHAAIRIARAATGRRRIVKFIGHYHGWFDSVFVGGPGQTVVELGTGGQDPAAVESVTLCQWNDLPALEAVMGDDVAAVIMEPVHANGGCIEPAPGYLKAVRDLTSRTGAMLIFDETVTGYRIALGGAQQYYDVLPDLTVLGKALGGGFPISAVCGPADCLEEVVSSRVLHLGTYNANVVSAAAAITVIDRLERDPNFYKRLHETSSRLASIVVDESAAHGFPLTVNFTTGLLHVFTGEEKVTSYNDACDVLQGYRKFSSLLVTNGVHVLPLGLMYVTPEHGDRELEITAEAVRAAAQVCERAAE